MPAFHKQQSGRDAELVDRLYSVMAMGDHDAALLELVRDALNDGRALAELEGVLLADGALTADEAAAAWLYAWAYDAARPAGDGLATQITDLGPPPRLRGARPAVRCSR